MTIVIESIFVGRPQRFNSEDAVKPWTSAIVKVNVDGIVRLRTLNLDGDQQADLVHHGGADKAVLAYPTCHYPFWNQRYADMNFAAGSFGENFALSGTQESDCCIGDIYCAGECRLQISQPRQPCWKLTRRWGLPDLAVTVQQTRRTGWYLRVLTEGRVTAGMSLELLERPYPELTVDWANQVMFAKPRVAADDQRLASCPLLSHSWRNNLLSRASDNDQEVRELRRLQRD